MYHFYPWPAKLNILRILLLALCEIRKKDQNVRHFKTLNYIWGHQNVANFTLLVWRPVHLDLEPGTCVRYWCDMRYACACIVCSTVTDTWHDSSCCLFSVHREKMNIRDGVFAMSSIKNNKISTTIPCARPWAPASPPQRVPPRGRSPGSGWKRTTGRVVPRHVLGMEAGSAMGSGRGTF